MSEERLQKILARAGYGSRRSCEELIVAGRVIVNGKSALIQEEEALALAAAAAAAAAKAESSDE